jgi:hypothetical protein
MPSDAPVTAATAGKKAEEEAELVVLDAIPDPVEPVG